MVILFNMDASWIFDILHITDIWLNGFLDLYLTCRKRVHFISKTYPKNMLLARYLFALLFSCLKYLWVTWNIYDFLIITYSIKKEYEFFFWFVARSQKMQELLQFVYYKEEEWTKDIDISIWKYYLLFTKKKLCYWTSVLWFNYHFNHKTSKEKSRLLTSSKKFFQKKKNVQK